MQFPSLWPALPVVMAQAPTIDWSGLTGVIGSISGLLGVAFAWYQHYAARSDPFRQKLWDRRFESYVEVIEFASQSIVRLQALARGAPDNPNLRGVLEEATKTNVGFLVRYNKLILLFSKEMHSALRKFTSYNTYISKEHRSAGQLSAEDLQKAIQELTKGLDELIKIARKELGVDDLGKDTQVLFRDPLLQAQGEG